MGFFQQGDLKTGEIKLRGEEDRIQGLYCLSLVCQTGIYEGKGKTVTGHKIRGFRLFLSSRKGKA